MIPIIDTLQPLGNFFAVLAEDVGVGEVSLEAVLHASELELAKKASKEYVDEQIASIQPIDINKKADKTYVDDNFAKKDEIPSKTSELINDSGFTTDAYTKPVGGIPKSDFESSVKASLDKADTALQSQSLANYVKKSELDAELSRKANTTYVNTELDKKANKADITKKADASTVSGVADRVSAVEEEQATLSSRMDTFVNLPEGATVSDARLEDICNKADGTKSDSPGNAVREQVTDLNEKIKVVNYTLSNIYDVSNKILADGNITKFTSGSYVNSSNGVIEHVGNTYSTDFIELKQGQQITATMYHPVNSGGIAGYAYYDENKNFVRGNAYYASSTHELEEYDYTYVPGMDNGEKYIRLTVLNPDTFHVYTSDTNFLNGFKDFEDVSERTKKTWVYDKMTQKPFDYENGIFNGSGEKRDSTTWVRLKSPIPCGRGSLIIVTVPSDLKCIVNYQKRGSSSKSNETFNKSFIIFDNVATEITMGFAYKNDTSVQADIENYINDINIYTGVPATDGYDLSLAASDSSEYEKVKADIVLSGTNDTDVIQALVESNYGIKLLLYPGTYHVTKLHTIPHDKPCAFSTSQYVWANGRHVEIVGARRGRMSHRTGIVKFLISEELHNSITEETAIFLVPRVGDGEDTKSSALDNIRIENIHVQGQRYDKPIVYFDFTQARVCEISDCEIHSSLNSGTLPPFEYAPDPKLTGIRVGHGSNAGIQNHVKHCTVMYCHTGVSCCGEHYVFEDVLVHHCYDAFAFGDRLTRGNYEHPNIMIGCSIEGSKRLMTLNRYGASEGVVDNPTNTLVCIGLSTETLFVDPETGRGVGTLPIHEVVKGTYRGRIECDYGNANVRSPFDEGSGAKMSYTIYCQEGTFRHEYGTIID